MRRALSEVLDGGKSYLLYHTRRYMYFCQAPEVLVWSIGVGLSVKEVFGKLSRWLYICAKSQDCGDKGCDMTSIIFCRRCTVMGTMADVSGC